MKASDGDAIAALARRSRAHHRGLAAPPRNPRQLSTYMASARKKSNSYLVVCDVPDGAIIGVVNFSQIFYGKLRSAYMGYWIGAPFAGKGFMTEAMPLALRHAFRTLKLHRVEANIQPHNTASIKLVKRAGFTKEGFSKNYLKVCGKWRDHERWAMVVDAFGQGQRTEGRGRRGKK